MRDWKKFEDDCFKYLFEQYGKNIDFKITGKENSTLSDILVIKPNDESFFIEVKKPKAQSGQFVLLPDIENKIFNFSPKNKSKENKLTDAIILHMNNNFDKYYNAGTAGADLELDKTIFYNWIEEYYKLKNVKYFITKNKHYIIFPTIKFHKYFDVTATYRIKRSGSSNPSLKNYKKIINEIKNLYGDCSYEIKDKKIFIYTDKHIDIPNFVKDEKSYYLAEKENKSFEVRKLSNTNNMNVIFSIILTSDQDLNDLKEFEDHILR